MNSLLLVETVSVFRLLVSVGIKILVVLVTDIADIFVDDVTVFVVVVVIVVGNFVVVITVFSDADRFADETGFCNTLVVMSEIVNENYS